MKKTLFVLVTALLATSSFAVPDYSNAVIASVLKNQQFTEILEKLPFTSVSARVLWSHDLTDAVIKECGLESGMSRSKTIVEVVFGAMTMNGHEEKTGTLHFYTPGKAEEVRLCK